MRADPEVHRKGESLGSPPFDAEVVDDDEREDLAKDVSKNVSRRLMMYSWSGRLPEPNDLRQYNLIVPGSAEKLVNDVVSDTKLAEQSIDIDRDVSNRVLTIMESQHQLEVEESRSDRDFRNKVFDRISPLLYLPLLVIILALFGPIGDAAKVFIILGVLIAYVAPVSIVLLKGRMAEGEKEVISSVVPAVVSAVTSVLKSRDSRASEPDQDTDPKLISGKAPKPPEES